MRKVLKRIGMGIVGFVLLAVVLGALFGTKEEKPTSQAASKGEATATSTPTAAPTAPPKPQASLSVPDREVYVDAVQVKGRVDPVGAHVRALGQRVPVSHGRFSIPVTFTPGGDRFKQFHVTATRHGYVSASTTVNVIRKLTSAEKAVIAQRRAAAAAARRAARVQAHANHRALEAAQNYLDIGSFSKQGLYEQLSSPAADDYEPAQAQWAVDHVHVDWNQEAVEAAKNYLDIAPMSRNELLDQLTSSAADNFTYEQALYAVNKVY